MAWLRNEIRREKWVNFVRTLSPEIDPKAVGLMDEIGAVSRAIYLVGERSLDDIGLSLSQYRVLMHLLFAEHMSERGELNPSEISDRHGVSRNAVSSLIRSLEDEELVERTLDPHDRRRFNISLTESGRSLVTDHARQHFLMIASCFSVLTSSEQETLFRLLHKIGEHVEAVRLPD